MRKRTFFDDYTGRNFNKATNIQAKGPEDHVKTQQAGPSFWFLWLVNTSNQYGTKYKPPNTPKLSREETSFSEYTRTSSSDAFRSISRTINLATGLE